MDRYLRRLMGGNFGRVVTVLVVVFAVTAAAVGHKLTETDIDNLTDDQLKDAYKLVHEGPVPDADKLRKDLKVAIEKPKPPEVVISNFRLNIVNGLDVPLQAEEIHYNNMELWHFEDVPSGGSAGLAGVAFYPSFIHGQEAQGSATVTYRIQQTEEKFTITAGICAELNNEPCFKVKPNLDHTTYAIYPLNLVASFKDGTFDIVVLPRVAVEGSSPPENVNSIPWMQRESDLIGKLTLSQLTVAGTHNSGSIKVEYPPGHPLEHPQLEEVIAAWAICQNDGFADQLAKGVRALDMRVGRKTNPSPPDSGFIIVHGQVPMNITLEEAAAEITEFLRTTSHEIVFLDFHALETTLDTAPSATEFVATLETIFSGFLLKHDEAGVDANMLLSDIWNRANTNERLIIACKFCKGDASKPWIWPDIQQKWFSQARLPKELEYALLDWYGLTYLGEPHPSGLDPQAPFGKSLFSSCLFTNNKPLPPEYQAEVLAPYIDGWFYGSGPWALRTFIAAGDFLPYLSNLVDVSIIASMVKAHRKIKGTADLYAPVHYTQTPKIGSAAGTTIISLTITTLLPLIAFFFALSSAA